MSNIDAVASDLFAMISAHIDKRVAAAVEKVLAEIQPKFAEAEDRAKEHSDRHALAIDEITGALDDRVKALESVPMPKDGEPGKDGASGKDADPVDLDALVKMVAAAVPKPTNGKDGTPGEDGRDGRDAIQCDVLDVIDPERRYQRGTYAHYKGGRIRAFRATDPLGDGPLEKAGWEVDVEGIAEIDVEQGEDLRSFAFGVQYTSGKTWVKTYTLPVMIYRKVWKKGQEYAQGDTASWDGSTWHCNLPTKAEPGNGEEWTLMTKRGANGKDALSIPGLPGPPGRAGRDLTQLGPNGEKW